MVLVSEMRVVRASPDDVLYENERSRKYLIFILPCSPFPHARPAPGDKVSREVGAHRPAVDALCMELVGIGLDCAASNGAGRQTLRRQRGAASLSFGVDRSANNPFPRLRQALERGWQRAAHGEQLENAQQQESAADDTPVERHTGNPTRGGALKVQGVPPSVPPTPSEVLTASSIRMMLGLASAFRRTNPAVLQVLCGTLLDLLLETPPLVLAPLHQTPSSVEAATVRQVSDFCAELVGSDDAAEREAALGLYLALAISRGQVSGMLEVVKCLLGHDQQVRLDVRGARSVGESGPPALLPSPDGGLSPSSSGAAASAAEPPEPKDPRVLAVLDRLANHSVYLHLSFPVECEGTRLAVKLQRIPREGSTGSGTPLADQNIKWDCPVTAATDGRFVFAWHPDFGLVKAGTGLDGTTKGRVYAQNSEAGCRDVFEGEKSTKEGFVAVIGNTVYLQTGCFMRLHRFLLARTSDLEVYGSADAVGLPFPIPVASPASTAEDAGRQGGDDERGWGGAAREDSEPFVPLCCDGRLVYAVVPTEVTGRPSVVAVDIANTGRVTGPAVELVRPRSIGATFAAGADKPELNNEQGAAGRRKDPGIGGGENTSSTAPEEWPWWQAGKGAKRGVRSYCNGKSLVVCWVDDEVAAAATEHAAASWGCGASRGESGPRGVIPGPNNASYTDDTDVLRPTHMVRFELSTGECDPSVENNAVLSGTSKSRIPWVAYDSLSNLILRCELLPLLPPTPSEHCAVSCAAEIRLCLWRNRGLTPGPALADGRLGWRGALNTLAGEREDAVEGGRPARLHVTPALSKTAVFVLAHLDRLGAYYLGWSGDCTLSGVSKPFLPPTSAERPSVPFCFDLSTPTFRHLAGLVEIFAAASFEAAVPRKDDEEKERGGTGGPGGYVGLYVLCASLRLLRVNVGILLGRGLGVVEFGGDGLRQSLLRCLLDLVRHCNLDGASMDSPSREEGTPPRCGQVGIATAAREALRLLVGGVDLFYPSHGHQAGLLSAYLQTCVTVGESHTTASRAVMLELLRRTSSLKFLRRLLASAGGGRRQSPELLTADECLLEPGLVVSCEGETRAHETVNSFSEALLELSSAQSVRNVRQAADSAAAGGFAATTRAEGVLLSDKSNDSAKQVELAVLESLGAVLKLRCIDVFGKARRSRGADPPAEFRAFLLLVLQAANNVLTVAVETQRSLTPAAADVLERVVGALRHGLVGTLLPSCLASALVLPEDGGMDGPGTDATDFLPQVARKLGLLVTAGQEPRGLEEGRRPPRAPWTERRVGTPRVGVGVAARGQGGRGNQASAAGAAEFQPEASVSKVLRR